MNEFNLSAIGDAQEAVADRSSYMTAVSAQFNEAGLVVAPTYATAAPAVDLGRTFG